ncbi:hypothetical protein psal_cds_438 [Pandoravirus salinus]|uniref:Uncharacterized protein n=1 Tax=Pandoravirus salinus TaxID=1349410 RepID=S4VXK0_9VIRU|nr:hypothetical protein psal_cds_438 [Pandoravirus salinus]AGO84186.1 hypothetical protein psal_cds_438 [Pandoravirus salinus]
MASAYVDTASGTVLVPAAAPTVALASPSRVPWGWIIVSIALLLLIALVVAIAVYEHRRRRDAPSTTIEPAQPLGRQLAAGTYRMRWGPTGLYAGVPAGGAPGTVAMVPVAQAASWTFAPVGGLGGTLTSTASGLLLGTATAVPAASVTTTTTTTTTPSTAPVLVVHAQPSATTGAWVPASDPSGQAAVPGTLYNTVLHGCARPIDNTNGTTVVVAASCAAAERGWYFEAVK